MKPIEACASLPTLADTLWAERSVMEHLLYKMVSARLLLAADQRAYVTQAMDEVERAADRLQAAERERLEALHLVARDWDVPVEQLTLRRLADEAPEPWATILRDHHTTFGKLADEIQATASENTRLASVGLNAVRTSLAAVTSPAGATYTAAGRHDTANVSPTSFDQAF